MADLRISDAGPHGSAEATDRIPASKAGVSGYLTPLQVAVYARTEIADTVTQSSTATLSASDMNRTQRVDATGGAVTLTLPSTGLTSARSWVIVYKADSSTNEVIIKNASAVTLATLTADEEGVELGYVSGNWEIRTRGWGGILQTPAGSAAAPAIGIGAADDGIYSSGTGIAVAIDGAQVWDCAATGTIQQSTGALNNQVNGETGAQITIARYSSNTAPSVLALRKNRGSIASPSDVVQNDQIGALTWTARGGGSGRPAATLRATVIDPSPGASSMETRVEVLASASSSVTPTDIVKWDHATGQSNKGVVTIDQSSRFVMGSVAEYTATNLASVAHAVNTTGKRQGLLVWDTTNNRMMRARAGLAASPWDVIDGSASVTPA